MALTSLMIGGVVNKAYMNKVMGSVAAHFDNMSIVYDVTTPQTDYWRDVTTTSQFDAINDTYITENQQTDVAVKVRKIKR